MGSSKKLTGEAVRYTLRALNRPVKTYLTVNLAGVIRLLRASGKVKRGSANLDPRSLHINTEMGLLIESTSLNAAMRRVLEPDFSLRNAWHLQQDTDGQMIWVSDKETLDHQPTHSYMRRIEDWFFSLLPIENEM